MKILHLCALSLPDEYKVDQQRLKKIFVDAIKDILPKEAYSGKKKGFEMPFITWMKGSLHKRLSFALKSNSAKKIFNAKFLNTLKKNVDAKNITKEMWKYLVLIEWMENYDL